MFDDELTHARGVKEKATAARNRGRFDTALQRLDEVIGSLQELLKRPDVPESSAKQVMSELADTFGMKGGVYRRMSDARAALQAYRQGLELEEKAGSSTYNLVNVIALSITLEGVPPSHQKIRIYLQRAIASLVADTGGPRKDEWWAWADLAQFHLLNGDNESANEAYASALDLGGATSKEINRHMAILSELANATAKSSPDVSKGLQQAVRDLEAKAASR